ncbi:MAG: ExeM/NucH family extracellular endonuclease [Acidimicrobiales bacterium]
MRRERVRTSCQLVLGVLAASMLSWLWASPASAVSPDIVVSQVYGGGGNSGAPLTHDYIELFNRGSEPVDLTGWSVQYASATGTGTFASNSPTALSGALPPGSYYLVQQAGGSNGSPLPTPDAVGTINMSASGGKVVAVRPGATLGLQCNGSDPFPCDASELARVADLVGYGGANFFEGSAAAPTLSNTTAALRDGDGETDTDDNASDFTSGAPNPRNSGFEPPPPPPSGCDAPPTHEIAAVQGAGDATPLAGQDVRVEGVVTGDFNGASQLGGFFIQDDTPDADPATSDGIFAFSSAAAAVGDRVLVNGRAIEFNGLTELSPVTSVDVCGTGTIAPIAFDLPRPMGTTFEPVESVLLTFPEAMTATEHFQLGRFGEVTVSSDGRLFQPTDRVAPGAPALAVQDENNRRRLLIDDGSTVQNPPTVPFVAPGDALRIGDTTSGVTGVLSFGFGLYRLQPTAPIAFERTNPRPPAPADVGGDVRVASFNTLNYFTTLGSENPNARGADTAEEFARQQAKLVAAITALDAHVIGLMEVENNGTAALASLVDALNAATAPGTYAFVTPPALNPPNEFGGTFGTDAIQVAFVYRPAAATPVGAAQSSADPIFDRPPLIQSFEREGGSEPFTAVVNHFKSKSCGGATGPDLDQGDGQACYNARRVGQATALADTLAALDVVNPLVLGDLNAYTEEDPIHALEAAGYTGLSEQFVADGDRYSFVFDGQSGELDHALAAPALLDNVTGTAIWHINADEPLILDYNTEFNPPGLYEPNAFRSSDHDPVLVGLQLGPAETATTVTTSPNPSRPGRLVTLTATVGGGSSTPTGTVTFFDGSRLLATVALDADGVASLRTRLRPPGVHTITATYSGDATHLPSASPPVTHTISPR